MKVIVARNLLLKSLSHIHNVVETRNTLPILTNVLLRAEGDTLTLRATDLELEISDRIAVKVEREGATTIPAALIHGIITKLPKDTNIILDENAEKNSCNIVCGASNFRLQSLSESNFPSLAIGEFSHIFSLVAEDLIHAIDTTRFAISKEETRYYLNGIYLHTPNISDGDVAQNGDDKQNSAPANNGQATCLRAVATDGHRLALKDVPAPAGAHGMPGIIIPQKAVRVIRQLLDRNQSDVKIELSESKIRISVESIVVTSKLIDGTFPDYMRVIPKHNDKLLRVERNILRDAVERAAIVSSDRSRAIKLMVSEDALKLRVENTDTGHAAEDMVDVSYDNEPMEIGFNSDYLTEIIKQISNESAEFKFADSGSPTLISATADPSALFVLMPMRI